MKEHAFNGLATILTACLMLALAPVLLVCWVYGLMDRRMYERRRTVP